MTAAQALVGRPRNPALDRAILSAASRQLSELGYAGMSLESVATAAGTTTPSIRRRYRNKADLVAAVISSLRVAEPPTSAPTPRAHALAILTNFHSNLRATHAMAVLGSLLAEEQRHPELLRMFTTHIVEPRRSLLRQALAAGDLPDDTDRAPASSSARSTAATSPPPASPTTGRSGYSTPSGPTTAETLAGVPQALPLGQRHGVEERGQHGPGIGDLRAVREQQPTAASVQKTLQAVLGELHVGSERCRRAL